MSNPTPRPALRKAEDAEVHPAAPRPARSPRRASVPPPASAPEPAPAPAEAPAPAKPAKPAEPKARGKRRYETPPAVPVAVKKRARKDFAGTTSDHLRPADAPTAAHDELHEA
jgi:monoamine oxidase